MNDTRLAGRILQEMREVKSWSFGPFFAGCILLEGGTQYSVGMFVTPWHSLCLQWTTFPRG